MTVEADFVRFTLAKMKRMTRAIPNKTTMAITIAAIFPPDNEGSKAELISGNMNYTKESFVLGVVVGKL